MTVSLGRRVSPAWGVGDNTCVHPHTSAFSAFSFLFFFFFLDAAMVWKLSLAFPRLGI